MEFKFLFFCLCNKTVQQTQYRSFSQQRTTNHYYKMKLNQTMDIKDVQSWITIWTFYFMFPCLSCIFPSCYPLCPLFIWWNQNHSNNPFICRGFQSSDFADVIRPAFEILNMIFVVLGIIELSAMGVAEWNLAYSPIFQIYHDLTKKHSVIMNYQKDPFYEV